MQDGCPAPQHPPISEPARPAPCPSLAPPRVARCGLPCPFLASTVTTSSVARPLRAPPGAADTHPGRRVGRKGEVAGPPAGRSGGSGSHCRAQARAAGAAGRRARRLLRGCAVRREVAKLSIFFSPHVGPVSLSPKAPTCPQGRARVPAAHTELTRTLPPPTSPPAALPSVTLLQPRSGRLPVPAAPVLLPPLPSAAALSPCESIRSRKATL